MTSFFTMFIFEKNFARSTTIDQEWKKIPAFIVCSGLYILMAKASIILGVLSPFQAVNGIILGLWTVYFCIKVLNPLLEKYYENVQGNVKLAMWALSAAVALTVAGFVIILKIYWKLEEDGGFKMDEKVIKNIENCSG